jgi:hypothetical protein
MDAAIIDSLNTRVELGETVSAETDEFVREHGSAYFRAVRERAWEDHTVGDPVSRDSLRTNA